MIIIFNKKNISQINNADVDFFVYCENIFRSFQGVWKLRKLRNVSRIQKNVNVSGKVQSNSKLGIMLHKSNNICKELESNQIRHPRDLEVHKCF